MALVRSLRAHSSPVAVGGRGTEETGRHWCQGQDIRSPTPRAPGIVHLFSSSTHARRNALGVRSARAQRRGAGRRSPARERVPRGLQRRAPRSSAFVCCSPPCVPLLSPCVPLCARRCAALRWSVRASFAAQSQKDKGSRRAALARTRKGTQGMRRQGGRGRESRAEGEQRVCVFRCMAMALPPQGVTGSTGCAVPLFKRAQREQGSTALQCTASRATTSRKRG
jgi:hypothetical protein